MRRGLAVGLWKKKTQKLVVHAGESGHNGGEKRNVLIVSVLLSIAIYFALRSEKQGGVCVECLIGKQKKPILFKVTEFHTVQNSSRVRQKGGVPGPPTRNPVKVLSFLTFF